MAGVTVLATRGLTRHYRRGPEVVRAVDGVTVDFPAGTCTLIVGPSGSGKSTLLHLLVGWERADSGAVLWQETPVDPATLRWQDVAVLPQRLALLSELTVAENVTLPVRMRGGVPDPIPEALGVLEFAGSFPDDLSQGQQQRVAVARLVAASPAVLIADEPTSSQDEASARNVLAVLKEQALRGSAVVIASHDPIAPEYADVVVRLRDGRVEG